MKLISATMSGLISATLSGLILSPLGKWQTAEVLRDFEELKNRLESVWSNCQNHRDVVH